MKMSEQERDALTEILNIAIGRAANSLNQMVHEEIVLSVPEIDFLSHDEAVSTYHTQFQGKVCAVKQHFESAFSGDTMLVFPERQSLSLVQLVLGDLVDDTSMTALEQEAMSEVGNVVLNACLSSIADQLGTPIKSTFPEFMSKSLQEILADSLIKTDEKVFVLMIKVGFHTQESEISGHIMLIVDIPSANTFFQEINAYVERSCAPRGDAAKAGQ